MAPRPVSPVQPVPVAVPTSSESLPPAPASETGSAEKLLILSQKSDKNDTGKSSDVKKDAPDADKVENQTKIEVEPSPVKTEPKPDERLSEPRTVAPAVAYPVEEPDAKRPFAPEIENTNVHRLPHNDVNKRFSNKVPAPVRPVSMINSVPAAVDKKSHSSDETDRVLSRTRSSSVSNRNRRRPSPPPLDKVLQIQANDKILNKNEVYRKNDTGAHANVKEPVRSMGGDRGSAHDRPKNRDNRMKSKNDSTSNIVISSGTYLEYGQSPYQVLLRLWPARIVDGPLVKYNFGVRFNGEFCPIFV